MPFKIRYHSCFYFKVFSLPKVTFKINLKTKLKSSLKPSVKPILIYNNFVTKFLDLFQKRFETR